MIDHPERSGQPGHDTAITPFIVDGEGNAYDEFSRQKESIIKGERLDALHPVVEIDLESILTEQSGDAVSIVIQDFGLPPRIIGISGDFTTMSELAGVAREERHYRGAPKVLVLGTRLTELDKTFTFNDKGLPGDDGQQVTLSRGESMLWAHDGDPSDEREGYIQSFWELTALLSQDYYGPADFSNLDLVGKGLRSGFVPLIGMTYKDGTLSIYALTAKPTEHHGFSRG